MTSNQEGIAEGHLSACEEENRELRAEVGRLRAIIEKLIGLSEYSDPELADALRNSLDNSKE
jgi:hypothetical protein